MVLVPIQIRKYIDIVLCYHITNVHKINDAFFTNSSLRIYRNELFVFLNQLTNNQLINRL